MHERPLVNGAPANTTADHARLVLADPSDQGVAPALALLGVKTILIHPGGPADVPVQPREPSAGYRLLGRFPADVSMWSVTAPAAPALAVLPGGFAAPQLIGGRVMYALVDSSGVGVIELHAKAPGLVKLEFDASAPNGEVHNVRIADATHEHRFSVNGSMHESVLVQVPRGVSQLLVKVDPAPTSLDDALLISAPRASAGSGSPQLQPDASSDDPGF